MLMCRLYMFYNIIIGMICAGYYMNPNEDNKKLNSFKNISIMKKVLISTLLLFGLSMNVFGQKHPPAPPHPSKNELINLKAKELDKKYNTEKKLIMNHPLATKQMKKDQMNALNKRYQAEKRLLKQAK